MPQPEDVTTKRIRETIRRSGWHISLMVGRVVPQYAHTIGLIDQHGHELLWAGGLHFACNQVHDIVNTAATVLLRGDEFDFRGDRFRLVPVDESWTHLLCRGAYVFLGVPHLRFRQVVPLTNRTLDVPDLSRPYDPDAELAWRWLTVPWPYAVPRSSVVSTDLNVLRGDPVTDVERWDDDLFAAHGRRGWEDADLRQAPLGTILALDPTCAPLARLRTGFTMHRDAVGAAWGVPFDLLDKEIVL